MIKSTLDGDSMELMVSNFIKQNNLILDKPIVCATSGGADSVCMLYVLYKLGYKVILAHVNHNKREESIIEQKEMEKFANKLNIPFELYDYHFDNLDNFHNAAHNARYKFFKDVCDKYNTNIIATAHHLDDQLETIIMKIIDGSNLYGYGGISTMYNDSKYLIVRPLLCVNKKDIYNYVNSNNLKYFEDSSNASDEFLRNRIRHHVVPLLKNEANDIYNKVSQYSLQLKEAFNFIRKQSIEYLEKNNNIIRLDSYNFLDIALKKDIISLLLENNDIRRSNQIIIDILNILEFKEGTKSIKLEGDYYFVRSYNDGYIKKGNSNLNNCVNLNIDDRVLFDDKYEFYFSKKIPVNNAKYIKLCYNTIELPFVIRNKMDGDEISLPIGNKKVSRVFIDYKVSLDFRSKIPIITDSKGNILWVYNYVKSKDVINQKELGDIYLVCEEK